MRSSWLWPIVVILSADAVSLVTFVIPASPMRPIIVMWFLFICPGTAPVRLLSLNEPVVEWTLIITLSLVIDAIVAGIQLYAGRWSPTLTLEILIAVSLAGAIVQLAIRLTQETIGHSFTRGS